VVRTCAGGLAPLERCTARPANRLALGLFTAGRRRARCMRALRMSSRSSRYGSGIVGGSRAIALGRRARTTARVGTETEKNRRGDQGDLVGSRLCVPICGAGMPNVLAVAGRGISTADSIWSTSTTRLVSRTRARSITAIHFRTQIRASRLNRRTPSDCSRSGSWRSARCPVAAANLRRLDSRRAGRAIARTAR